MFNYLLCVTFFAGSDDAEDTDKDMFLLSVDKEYSEKEMKDIFFEVNKILNIDFADDLNEEFGEEMGEEYFGYPCYYEEGINIHTLMEGVKLHTKGKLTEIYSNCGKIEKINNCYVIEQWQ